MKNFQAMKYNCMGQYCPAAVFFVGIIVLDPANKESYAAHNDVA